MGTISKQYGTPTPIVENGAKFKENQIQHHFAIHVIPSIDNGQFSSLTYQSVRSKIFELMDLFCGKQSLAVMPCALQMPYTQLQSKSVAQKRVVPC